MSRRAGSNEQLPSPPPLFPAFAVRARRGKLPREIWKIGNETRDIEPSEKSRDDDETKTGSHTRAPYVKHESARVELRSY